MTYAFFSPRTLYLLWFSTAGVAAFFLLLWSLLFHAYSLFFLVLTGWSILLPIKIFSSKYAIKRLLLFIIWSGLSYSMYTHVIFEINQHITGLSAKLSRHRAETFNTQDKISIYGLNILMGTAALPLYPQAAKETLLMIFPPPSGGFRRFKSDFPLGSRKIRKTLQSYSAELRKQTVEHVNFSDHTIVWNTKDYLYGNPEAPYALALNAAVVSADAEKKDNVWNLSVYTRVKVRYPEKSLVTLIRNPKLNIEEGLFWVLQQCGWLHTYTAVWESHMEIAA